MKHVSWWKEATTYVIVAAVVIGAFGTVLKAFAPFTTTCLVLYGTFYALQRKQGMMALGGLSLYGASWLMPGFFSPVTTAIVCSAGIGLWFWAFMLAGGTNWFWGKVANS